MEQKNLNILKGELQHPKKVVIIPHRNPDGDAMGSTLGLNLLLLALGHESIVISPNAYPDFLNWIPGSSQVIFFDRDQEKAKKFISEADLIFTLDFNLLSRTGDEMGRFLEETPSQYVMIDHHQQPGDYAEFMYSDTESSSTCELVYHFMELLNYTSYIDADIASCLYTGIMTDTGSFRFPSTSSQTHRVIAHLMDKGANNAQIHQQIYDTRSPEQLKLLGVALNNLKVIAPFHTAYITLSQDELDAHHYKKGDTEGFVNYGLSLEHIKFAVIFIENKAEGIIKISFRSKGNFDVNHFARAHFNGGGHVNAAGGRSDEDMEKTIHKFESLLKDYKDQLMDQS